MYPPAVGLQLHVHALAAGPPHQRRQQHRPLRAATAAAAAGAQLSLELHPNEPILGEGVVVGLELVLEGWLVCNHQSSWCAW